MNCAPALSKDGATLYIAVNTAVSGGTQTGYLLALDSTTLATKAKVELMDPNLGAPAWVSDDGTASPVVGPDGRVFYGVLEAQYAHAQRARLAAAVRRAAQFGRRAGQLRLGRVAERDPGLDGAVIQRQLHLPAGPEVQQLRRRGHAATGSTGSPCSTPGERRPTRSSRASP